MLYKKVTKNNAKKQQQYFSCGVAATASANFLTSISSNAHILNAVNTC